MKDVVVIGAGKIGVPIAGLLASTGDYKLCRVAFEDKLPEWSGSIHHLRD